MKKRMSIDEARRDRVVAHTTGREWWTMKFDSDTKESIIERYLVREVEKRGALCVKHKAVRRGWPDRNIYWPLGVHDLVETKRPKGGKWEPLQLRTHDKLRRMGHNVFVLLTKEQVNAYIRQREVHMARLRRVRAAGRGAV